jgi:hypothetical protein
MVTSEAYQRASAVSDEYADSQRIDPGDTALWHFRLQRLEAEPIWDAIHTAAGDLDLTVGGRSFDVRQGGDEPRRRGMSVKREAANTKRRGAYMIRGYSSNRDVTPSFLQAFDVDDGRAPCPLRTQTVTAPQALFLMNSPDIDAACKQMATRLQNEAKGDLPSAVDLAYRVALARPPSSAEKSNALAYLESDPARLKDFSWLLFNLDEFIYAR